MYSYQSTYLLQKRIQQIILEFESRIREAPDEDISDMGVKNSKHT